LLGFALILKKASDPDGADGFQKSIEITAISAI
jgi:hypothetical protein